MYQLIVNNLNKKGNERINFNNLEDCKSYINKLPNDDYILDVLQENKVSGNYMVIETINIDKK